MLAKLQRPFFTLLVLMLALTTQSAGVAASSSRTTLAVNNHGAPCPLMVGFANYAEQKIPSPDGAANGWFGISVALSGDTALVGANQDDSLSGAAYVFTRSDAAWSLQQKLSAAEIFGVQSFGDSVAFSGDAAIVGSSTDSIGENFAQGSAFVFTRSGTTWNRQQRLIASDGAALDNFGSSVAISGDTALVGAFGDGLYTGSAYVFTRSGTTWSQQAKLTAWDGQLDDWFGVSVAVSGDTALIGAMDSHFDLQTKQGAAYVFTRNGTIWSLQQKLTASDGSAYDEFGHSVALSGDTALVGSFGDFANQGAAYVFVRNGTTWGEQAKLTASDGFVFDNFGMSVALSGESAVVGADKDDIGSNTDQGSAYVFTRSGTSWTQRAKLTASDGQPYNWYGTAVAVSGNTALVGSFGDNHYVGAAYFYDIPNNFYLPLLLAP